MIMLTMGTDGVHSCHMTACYSYVSVIIILVYRHIRSNTPSIYDCTDFDLVCIIHNVYILCHRGRHRVGSSLSLSPVNAAASAALPLVLGSQGCATKCALADTALQCPFTVVRFVCRRQAVGVNRCTSSQQRDSIVMQQDSVGMYFYATDPGPSRRTTTRSSRILLTVSTNAMSSSALRHGYNINDAFASCTLAVPTVP